MDGCDDNVLSGFFLQHGEDNGYDPDDFVQEIDVGSLFPRFHISVADDDGGIPGSLFACAVWNGAVGGVTSNFCYYGNLSAPRRCVMVQLTDCVAR